jgi:urease accessory protein
MSNLQRQALCFLSIATLLLLPTVAQAHVGIGSTTGFFDGIAHPFSGVDHICAMIGVGLWAAQRGGRAIWFVPLAFVVVMMAGGLLGMAHVFVPFVEPGIIASVLILGLLIATAARWPLAASACLVAVFALFHGHAHGAEMPATAAGISYGLGFIASTIVLHGCGIGCGIAANKAHAPWVSRYSGAAMIVCGLGLCCAYLG